MINRWHLNLDFALIILDQLGLDDDVARPVLHERADAVGHSVLLEHFFIRVAVVYYFGDLGRRTLVA